jgi:hypothetical protein
VISVRVIFICLFFLLPEVLSAQQKPSDDARRIIKALAAENLHGRGYVHRGDSLAAAWIQQEIKDLGLTCVKQRFKHTVNTFPDSAKVTVGTKKLIPGIDFQIHPSSGSSIGNFDILEINNKNFTDVALMKRIYSRGEPEFTGAKMAVLLDPKGINNKDSLMEFNELIYSFAQNVPVIVLTYEKLTWSVSNSRYRHAIVEMKNDAWDNSLQSISLNIRNEFITDYVSSNLITVIPGTHRKKKKQHLLITAHYDHLGRMGSDAYIPGANDNASGMAMMLQLMRYYTGNKPEYTLVFIAFAAEEAGLVGSKYYTEHPHLPLNKARFLLNLDLMGTGEEGITVVNATLFPDEFKKLQALNAVAGYVPKIKARGEAANSDHYWFTKAGVKCFFVYTLGGSKAYHDVNDKPEQLSLAAFDNLFTLFSHFLDGF